MSSYGYYQWGEPLVDDAEFDRWCKVLERNAAHCTHPHRHLCLTYDDFFGWSAGVILGENEYPSIVKSAYLRLVATYDELASQILGLTPTITRDSTAGL